jgi:class 3 adenylate cyclase
LRGSLDHTALRARLDALRGFAHLPGAAIDRIGEVVASLPAWDLHRINPLDLAERHGLEPATTVELFVHGARVGLFDMSWNTVCVFCGAVELFHESIDEVPSSHFHCTPCDADIDTLLDERIEVTFSLATALGRPEVDPYRDLDSYLRWFISPWVTPSPEARELFDRYRLGFLALAPGQEGELAAPRAGEVTRLVSYDRHASAVVRAEAGGATEPPAFTVLPAGIYPSEVTMSPGSTPLRVRNRCDVPVGVVQLAGDARAQQEVVETHRATLRPYMTGRSLLNTQCFRELFRVQSDNAHLALRMRHLTVVFTDLRDSTLLYDQLGDPAAYRIVREHLHELVAATRRHGGAVVKTIGDAIMATFSSPADGVRAAIEMQRRITELGERATRLGLKIGVHVGPALVVNAEGRLDYFGHTVNVAARVQALAAAGEMCVTREVHDAPGVVELLERSAEHSTTEVITIRGVTEAVTVHHVGAFRRS